MRDPTAMPMMIPVDSCVGLEGWSRFGDRAARPGELVPAVEKDGMIAEMVVVVLVAESETDEDVTVCCIQG